MSILQSMSVGAVFNSKEVAVLTSDSSLQTALEKSTVALKQGVGGEGLSVDISPSQCLQQIDGFGAAITGSTCYNLMHMTSADRHAFLMSTFSPDCYDFSYVRISIGCSDFSLSEYSCCDTPGIENFALTEEETRYVIPVLKEILAINPDLKIMGSPWTSPKWMKVNNLKDLQPFDSWTSGQLNPYYYNDYAEYFVKWIKAFEDEGINIYSVTIQNEPLNRGNSASMFMGWEEQRDFVKYALGPKFKEAGVKAKIYAFDHNYNYDNMVDQEDYPLKIYADSEAEKYLAGAAYHNYGGQREELISIHDSAPRKELVFTETSIGTWNDGRNVGRRLVEDMWEVTLGTVNNWCRGAIVWNLMLDTDRGPNRDGGCRTCYGAVDIDEDYRTITLNSHYYAIAHMAYVVKTGAVRVQTSGYAPETLQYSAFVNPDGTMAFVVANRSDKAEIFTVNCEGNCFTVSVPARGVSSFRWVR